MRFKFRHLAVGGTFDLLHKGHKSLLEFAFKNTQKVSIGITSDEMASLNGKSEVANLSTRKEELENFLEDKGLKGRYQIIVIDDVYGTTISDRSIEALVLTKETLKGGSLINQKRHEIGLSPIALIKFPMILADDGKPISTSRIRKSLIDRKGFVYFKFLSKPKRFLLPTELRSELSKVHGQLINEYRFFRHGKFSDGLMITVGDEITKNFVQSGRLPDLSIVDFRINRKKVFSNLTDLGFSQDQRSLSVRNDPGTIDKSLIKAVHSFFTKKKNCSVIKVEGEEDLAVLPVVLLAPLRTRVFYGQPNQGLVLVDVTEAKKAEFLKILKRFHINR